MGNHQLQESHGFARFTLPRGTIIKIQSAPKAICNLLSFKDIIENRFHIETSFSGSNEVINLINKHDGDTIIKESIQAFLLGFHTNPTSSSFGDSLNDHH
jgi:hypothetical protein